MILRAYSDAVPLTLATAHWRVSAELLLAQIANTLQRSGAFLRGLRLKRQNLAPAAADYALQVIAPDRQRGADLLLVSAAIVSARDARLVAGLMIDRGLDDMRLDTKIGHPGGHAAANIVDNPIRHHLASETAI